MKHSFEFTDNGSGEVNFSQEGQMLLYKLAAECFKNGSDGCDFILNDIEGYEIKTTVIFQIKEVK